jgi:hypothetical protein
LAADGGRIIQLAWCAGTAVLGLLLALVLDASPATAALGWTLAALGAIGVALAIALPMRGRRR